MSVTTVCLRSGERLILQPSATRQSVQLTVKFPVGFSKSFLVANEDWAVIAMAGTMVAEANAAALDAGMLAPPAGAHLSDAEGML